jgi:tRNA nucleotidyltransferase/poly(A) polymerase
VTLAPPSLADRDWLNAPAARAIFAAIGVEGDEIRIVGGAVRNALMGLPATDTDFATTATPEIVSARAAAAGFKVVPTGIDHGTVTVVTGGEGHEVTTLREDVATDGRHAVVRFGRDWRADAERRDFTVNALSVDAAGIVHDPLRGYGDILERRIRFIGDADRRIAEDRLRILRFFRFHADYGEGAPDAAGLAASIRARNGIRDLSAERVGQEMRKLAVARRAAATVADMQDAGILPIVLGGVGYVGTIRRLEAFEAHHRLTANGPLRLAAIGCRIEEDAVRLFERLRLSNAEFTRMTQAVAGAALFARSIEERVARRALYALGSADAYRDAVSLAFAWSGAAVEDPAWASLIALPERWTAPVFPLGGRDVIGGTAARGPLVGTLLRDIEQWWIDKDFGPDEETLRARLQQMAAAAQ